MENTDQKKLVRVYKKVTAVMVYVWESPTQNYEVIGKEDDGSNKYGYVQKPGSTTKEEVEEVLYEQKFDEADLNVKELTLWANRVK